jgi:hypothetical protein
MTVAIVPTSCISNHMSFHCIQVEPHKNSAWPEGASTRSLSFLRSSGPHQPSRRVSPATADSHRTRSGKHPRARFKDEERLALVPGFLEDLPFLIRVQDRDTASGLSVLFLFLFMFVFQCGASCHFVSFGVHSALCLGYSGRWTPWTPCLQAMQAMQALSAIDPVIVDEAARGPVRTVQYDPPLRLGLAAGLIAANDRACPLDLSVRIGVRSFGALHV